MTNAKKDLLVIGAVFITVLICSYYYNTFIILVDFFKKHPNSIGFIDEIITGFLTLTIGLGVFSFRRWLELKKETDKNIKLQEELTNQAKTQADVERIIARQLRAELDYHKKIEDQLLKLIPHKR
ncbi:MAG: hypothetical protein HQL23_02290 [Candidatus Omnitrophica bacterium]|nr:hypothetical protein [Candidatus Omnitrophota bacterium]